ncbi:GtrA family protein [Enterococcus alcedinis]|nr:GtrA family protein [Enterococcus alcedinis]
MFGILTKLVNFFYFTFKSVIGIEMIIANSFSWLLSVLFAYVTNRIFVFKSKAIGGKQITFELVKFVFYRGLSFVLDMLSMLLLIEILHFHDFYAKLITQVIIVVANFLFSKWLIFKN